MQTTEPPAAHQKGEPVNLKHYDCSEVLDLSQKTKTTSDKTTSSTLPAGEDGGNNDDTIIYEILDEQDVENEVQQPKEHDPDNESTDVGRGKYFPLYLFDNIQLEIVTSIPEDIDDQKYYIWETDDQSWHEITRDRGNFVMHTSSRQGFKGIRKIGYCHGSRVCPNSKWPFLSTSHMCQSNKINWKTQRGSRDKICQSCEHYGKEEGCGARKPVKYLPAQKIACVFHPGKHTCTMKLDTEAKKAGIKRKATISKTGSAKTVAIWEIENLNGEGQMEAAESEAQNWIDIRIAKRVLSVMDWISLLMTLINILIFTVMSSLSNIIMSHGAKTISIPFKPL